MRQWQKTEKGYLVGKIYYKTKKVITEKAKAILHSSPIGYPLQGDDYHFIRGLLDYHPAVEEKIKHGERFIFVLPSKWGTRGFYIIANDTSKIDFSYRICLNPKLYDNTDRNIKKACRQAIEYDMIQFKLAYFREHEDGEVLCPIIEMPMTFDNTEVDHVSPLTFIEIYKRWRQSINGISLKTSHETTGSVFVNSQTVESFRQFHNEIAQLRMLSARGNQVIREQERKGR